MLPTPGMDPVRAEEDGEDNICFRNESNKETEGFADDTTGLSLFELSSLSALKQIMIDFGRFSGLKCNVEKTVLMQIGNHVPPSQEIIELGFMFVEEIKILGMTIYHSIENLVENFVQIHERTE
jgi:hypothetical protein